MPKKETVSLNLDVVPPLIKKKFRSNVIFCENMGRTSGKWVSDWCRKDTEGNPKPKNLPSHEEAAKMCLLLETTPDVILMHEGETEKGTAKCQEDLALVWELYEKLKAEKGIKKDPSRMGEVEMTDVQKEAWALILSWDDEKLKKFIAGAKAMLGD